MRNLLFFPILSFLFMGQIKAQEEEWTTMLRAGSRFDLEETYTHLKNRLVENPEIKIFAEIDHSKNAREVGLELEPARVIIFGNAKAGTPLMQDRQLVGLDLPLKILVGEDEKGKVLLVYSAVDYLKMRHALNSDKVLNNIKKSLKKIVDDVTGRNPKRMDKYKIRYNEGIESIKSKLNFKETLSRLKKEITAMNEVSLFAEIDHTKNAEELGMRLRPTTLLVFGNPKVGTILIQEARHSALELPVKMLVWQDENGAVRISYNSSQFLARRFGIDEDLKALDVLNKAKRGLAQKAAGHTFE